MKHSRHFLIVLLFLLVSPRAARAEGPEPVTAVPPGEDVIVALKKGESAPFPGQLFDQSTALRWANYLQQYSFRLQADVEYQKKYDAAAFDGLKAQLELEREAYARTTADMQQRLDTLQQQLNDGPVWYRTAEFGVVMGVVSAVAIAFSAAALVNATK